MNMFWGSERMISGYAANFGFRGWLALLQTFVFENFK